MPEFNLGDWEDQWKIPLVKVILIPVGFSAICWDENGRENDGPSHRVGEGLSDEVGGMSDCNRAFGRIYRKAGPDEDWSGFPDDVIIVYVHEKELPKFDRVYF